MRSFDRVHVLLTHKLQVKNKDIISKHMRMCIYMTLYFYKNPKKKKKGPKKKKYRFFYATKCFRLGSVTLIFQCSSGNPNFLAFLRSQSK